MDKPKDELKAKREEVKEHAVVSLMKHKGYDRAPCEYIVDIVSRSFSLDGVVIKVDRIGEDKYFRCWRECPRNLVAAEPLIETHCPVCGKEAHLCKCPVINRGSFSKYVEPLVEK